MILTIDTSTATLTVAIANNAGDILKFVKRTAELGERGIHDVRLATEVQDLLRTLSLSPKDIERIAIIIGPGSFTGLRIGLSFAKGLSFACGAGIVPLTQHEVLASENGFGEYIATQGYQPKLVYLAKRTAIPDIRLVDEVAYVTASPSTILLMGTSYPQFVGNGVHASITPQAMARLAIQRMPLVSLQIDSLEPLYITEFSPSL